MTPTPSMATQTPVDSSSLHGTYVNRQPVQSAVLAHGDEIQIGKFRLLFLTPPRPNQDRLQPRPPSAT